MIPRAHITAWRAQAPWPDDAQVEQDLILSRALVEIFESKLLARSLVFRGGTALHKLFFAPPGRYSEDIDLVQIEAGKIGPVLDALRERLDPWLGEPTRKRGEGRVTLLYRFETTGLPAQTMRLKVEINTREHFNVLDLAPRRFEVESPWFSGGADLTVYALEELLGTKLRALYQRKKGRDLYDLWLALGSEEIVLDAAKIVECFGRYLEHGNTPVTRAQFEANLAGKLEDPAFTEDIVPLLQTGADYDAGEAAALVRERLLALLPGDPWKGK
ncbi:MAG: nucleotidyl transferase AbiEii/AbiGii toxin family protein [Bdellovibrionota bacterium]